MVVSESTSLLSGENSAGSGATTSKLDKEDDSKGITLGRRVSRYLSRYSWYYPQRNSGESHSVSPSLDKAWDYYEKVTLPRYFKEPVGASEIMSDQFIKAEPGESEIPTSLYPVWGTPEDDLGDFGVGVGLYFWSLRVLAIIMFLAGLINIPGMIYYASGDYTDNKADTDIEEDRKFIFTTSAICTDNRWVPCPNCTLNDWDVFPSTETHYAQTMNGDLHFILKHECEASFELGLFSMISLVFVFLSVAWMLQKTKKRAQEFDVTAQTTTDYSVEVLDPPEDATDPEEWRDFFGQFGDVVALTVVLNNQELIKALVARRRHIYNLKLRLPPDFNFSIDDLDAAAKAAWPLSIMEKIYFKYDGNGLVTQIRDLDGKIQQLSQKKYGACEVFVTFETEQAQRNALSNLSVSNAASFFNRTSVLKNTKYAFRGTYALNVIEPPEPDSVRWLDLADSLPKRNLQNLGSWFITLVLVFGSGTIIAFCRDSYGAALAALAITGLNSITPQLIWYVTDYLESHHSEGSKQASRFGKITLCLFVNTTIVTSIITPFADTIANSKSSIIRSIYAIYICEIFKAPITQLLDMSGHFFRHYFAPRAPDQWRMNLIFQGTYYEISERYTDMINILFITFFYAQYFPIGFILGAIALAVHYWTDKYCLLRNWFQAPAIGTDIAHTSRIFISMTLMVFAVMTAYSYSAFPADNVCGTENKVSPEYIGDFSLVDGAGNKAHASIGADDVNHIYCNQDFLRYNPIVFPPIPAYQPEGKEWMTDSQAQSAAVFGWIGLVAFGLGIVAFCYRVIFKPLRAILKSTYKMSGDASNITFSEVPEIFGYIPQIKLRKFPFPLLICDIRGISHDLLNWTDPDKGHDHHNVIFDVPGLIDADKTLGTKENLNLLSVVKHWPPKK